MIERVEIVRLPVTFDHSYCQGLVYNSVQVICIMIAISAKIKISALNYLSAQYILIKQSLDG